MPPVGKIALLPEAMRVWLHKAFVERGFGDIVALTDELNALCKAGGVAITIGKSAVGEASRKYKRAQESIAAVTRQMQAVADSAGDNAARRSEALNALVSTELFGALVDAREAEGTDDPEARVALMNKAALAAARLTNASVLQQTFRAEVEARTRDAADKAAKIAKRGGADPKTVAEIRASILGIVKRDSPTTRPGAANAAPGAA